MSMSKLNEALQRLNGPKTPFKAPKISVGTKPPSRMDQLTVPELISMDLPNPKEIVEGLLTEGLNLLVSRPKMGKSWMALAVGLGVASGEPVLGGAKVDQGDVLYLALEDNLRRLRSRIIKLLDGREAPTRMTIATSWPRLDEGAVVKMEEWINQVDNPTLIIVDTLARIKKVRNNSSDRYAEDYADLGELKSLADHHSLSLWGLHHVRKLIAEDYLDEVSGTMGITAAADTITILNRERGKDKATLMMTGRDISEKELGLLWNRSKCCWSITGSAKEARMSGQRLKVYEALREFGVPVRLADIAQHLGWELNNVKQHLFQMSKDGLVYSDRGLYSPLEEIEE